MRININKKWKSNGQEDKGACLKQASSVSIAIIKSPFFLVLVLRLFSSTAGAEAGGR